MSPVDGRLRVPVYQALASALFASLVAIFATRAIERLGPSRGGLVGTVPTTIVPAAWGIWAASSDATSFSLSMAAVPVGMLVNAIFLGVWLVLPTHLPGGSPVRRLGVVTGASMFIWLALASLVTMLLRHQASSPGVRVGSVVALVVTVGLGAAAARRSPSAVGAVNGVSPAALAGRGALAALVVGTSVSVAALGNPLLAGVAATVPAIFVTTMVSLWLAQGEAVAVSATGPMMLGSAAVGGFALAATLTFPTLGPTAGTIAAWLIAVAACTLPAAMWLRRAGTGEVPTRRA